MGVRYSSVWSIERRKLTTSFSNQQLVLVCRFTNKVRIPWYSLINVSSILQLVEVRRNEFLIYSIDSFLHSNRKCFLFYEWFFSTYLKTRIYIRSEIHCVGRFIKSIKWQIKPIHWLQIGRNSYQSSKPKVLRNICFFVILFAHIKRP